ncbi:MAG: FG-GAP-like repeat-containing protein [Planctomycetota bacterium]|nr:FG-GAP-like repeat-containing protein [Planctomycetota bacterium]
MGRFKSASILRLGILVILLCGTQSSIVAQPPQGAGSFAFEYSIPVIEAASDMALGDFNNDGILDMVVTSPLTGTLQFFPGALGGGFQTSNSEIFAAPVGATEAASFDYDGDGFLDLIILTNSGGVNIVLGNGNGTFQPGSELNLNLFITSIEIGELNGDGQLDLAICALSGISGGGETRLLLSDGINDYDLSPDLFPNATAVALADVDDDGDLDLITAGADLTVHLNDGTAGFIVSQVSALPYEVAELDVAELIDDPNPGITAVDIICLTDGGEGLGFLLGVGGGFFSVPTEGYAAELSNAKDMTLVELDGQGPPELVFISQDSTSHLGVLKGYGLDGLPFEEGIQQVETSQDPQCLKLLDINQDGILDAIVASSALNLLEVFLGQPASPDFTRGDVNDDLVINLADAILILEVLFQSNDNLPACSDRLDCNDDGSIDLSDPITELNYLFGGLSSIPQPFFGCGSDPTADSLECLISLTSSCP